LDELLGLETYWHLRNLVLSNAPDPGVAEVEITNHVGIRRRSEVPVDLLNLVQSEGDPTKPTK